MEIQTRVSVLSAVIAVLLLSGCVGFLTGDSPAEFSSDSVGVNNEALNETNYSLSNEQNMTTNRSVTVAGEERQVIITNHLKSYQKQNTVTPSTSAFTAFSTPDAKIIGESVNPLAQLTNDELLETVLDKSGTHQVTDVENVSAYNLTVQGDETVVDVYEGTTTIEGQNVDVYIHLTNVQMDNNVVVAVGVYPQQTDDMSRSDIKTLIQGLEVQG